MAASVTVPLTVPTPPGGTPKSALMLAPQNPVISTDPSKKPSALARTVVVSGLLSGLTSMSVSS